MTTIGSNSSVQRIAGLGSGMDISGTISKLMTAASVPLDGLNQQQQILLWKEQQYRTQNTAMSTLRDSVFNLKMESTYNARSATSSNQQVATATVTASSSPATYNLVVTQMATNAMNTSSAPLTMGSSLTGNFISNATIDASHNSFNISLDGVSKKITLPPSAYGTYSATPQTGQNSVDNLAAAIQTQLNAAGLAAPVYAKATSDHELVFYAGQTADGTQHNLIVSDQVSTSGQATDGSTTTLTLANAANTGTDYTGKTIKITAGTGAGQTATITGYDSTTNQITVAGWAGGQTLDATSQYEIYSDDTANSLGFNNNASSKELVGSILEEDGTKSIAVASGSDFKIALANGQSQDITLDQGNYTPVQLAQAIESKVRALGGDFDNVRVSASNYNQIRFDTVGTSGATPASITLNSGANNDFLTKLGFTAGANSDINQTAFDPTASMYSQKDMFLNSSFFTTHTDTTNSSFGFSINGQSFSFKTSNSMNDIVDGINANSAAGVTAYYDQFTNKMVLTSNKAGNLNANGVDIQINDSDNFLSQVLNISSANEVSGKNAKISLNGYDTQEQSNTFTLNNTTFNLTGTGSTTIVVNTDTSAIATKLQTFVTNYNSVVASMNTSLNQARPTDNNKNLYLPLTDAQKSAMSTDDITAWTTKAQEGLLQNDDLLQSTLTSMRSSIARQVAAPTSVSGLQLSGTIDLHNANQFQITVGTNTRTISLDQNAYTSSNYSNLVSDFQNKLDATFGKGTVKVGLSNSQITLTTSNDAVTLNNATTANGLNKLGFSDGAAIKTTYTSLANIGITTALAGTEDALSAAQENGKLYFDQTKFTQAMQSDPAAVMRLLTANGMSTDASGNSTTNVNQEGIFNQFYDTTNNLIKQITNKAGVSDADNSSTLNSLGKQVTDISKQITDMQDKLNAEESRLWTEFNNMDTMISKLNSQSALINSLLGNNSSNSNSSSSNSSGG